MNICKIEDCQRQVKAWGWCGTHWLRWRKYGDPLTVKRSGVDFNVKTSCTIGDCERPNQARGMCSMHYSRWKKHGDATIVGERLGRPLKGDVPTWGAIHRRLYRSRGIASTHPCTDCGLKAREWSYNGRDAEELFEPFNGTPVAYSLDLSNYDPRCTSCHRKFDGAGDRPRNETGQFLPGADITVRVIDTAMEAAA